MAITDESKTMLSNMEQDLSKRAMQLQAKYAFVVVLSSQEYAFLEEAYRINAFSERELMSFPWCSLKMITEASARALDHSNSLKQSINKLIPAAGPSLWDLALPIIDKLNLESNLRREGPWYIYSNIVLHAGIPKSYAASLLSICREALEYSANARDALDFLCRDDDVFKYQPYSTYFKEVFSKPKYRRMLFSWLLMVLELPPENLTRASEGLIPQHITAELLTPRMRGQSQISQAVVPKGQETFGLEFDFDSRSIQYHIRTMKSTTRNDFGLEVLGAATPGKWTFCSNSDMVRRVFGLVLNVSPSELALRIRFRTNSLHRALICQSDRLKASELLVFDPKGSLVTPETPQCELPATSDSFLMVVSSTPLPVDVLSNLPSGTTYRHWDDLPGEWYLWYRYRFDFTGAVLPVSLRLPPPYGSLRVQKNPLSSNIKASIPSRYVLPVLSDPVLSGGDVPPSLVLEHPQFTAYARPFVHCAATVGDYSTYLEGTFRFISQGRWEWVAPTVDFPEAPAGIFIEFTYADISLSQMEARSPGRVSCVWHPGFTVSISCSGAILPNKDFQLHISGRQLGYPIEAQNLKILANSKQQLILGIGGPSELPDHPLVVENMGRIHELVIPNPYLSIFVYSRKTGIKREFPAGSAYTEEWLTSLHGEDPQARISFSTTMPTGNFWLIGTDYERKIEFDREVAQVTMPVGDLLPHYPIQLRDREGDNLDLTKSLKTIKAGWSYRSILRILLEGRSTKTDRFSKTRRQKYARSSNWI